ncbi:MAG: hypothetical protein ACXVEF_17505 [Polyangiales bacterium]
MMRSFSLVAVLVHLVALMGCSSQAKSTGITESDIACPTDSTLTYENFAKPLVEGKCLSCHSGNQQPNLSTQGSLVVNKTKILAVAVYTDDMPREGSMTADERTKLGQWISCGAH